MLVRSKFPLSVIVVCLSVLALWWIGSLSSAYGASCSVTAGIGSSTSVTLNLICCAEYGRMVMDGWMSTRTATLLNDKIFMLLAHLQLNSNKGLMNKSYFTSFFTANPTTCHVCLLLWTWRRDVQTFCTAIMPHVLESLSSIHTAAKSLLSLLVSALISVPMYALCYSSHTITYTQKCLSTSIFCALGSRLPVLLHVRGTTSM